MHIALRAALACGLAHSAIAADIHVQPGQSIQAAIVSAQSGDRILVHPGTYAEAIDLLTKDLVIESVGGAAVTTIDATGLNTSVVRTDGGQTSSPKLIGLTLTGGSGSSAPSGLFGGGGVLVGASGGSPFTVQIHSCVITHNHVGAGFGGGVLLDGTTVGTAPVQLLGCTVDGNSALRGGGTYGSISLDSCTIANNVAQAEGGGSFLTGPLKETTFVGNSAQNGGGAWFASVVHVFPTEPFDYTLARFINNVATNAGGGAYVGAQVGRLFDLPLTGVLHQCLFRGNAASVGGGVYAQVSSGFPPFQSTNQFSIASCVFTANSAGMSDGAHIARIGSNPLTIRVENSSFDGDGIGGDVDFVSACIFRNAPSPFVDIATTPYAVTNSNVQGWPTGNGNIDVDPQWVNPAANDYRLTAGSPCIDVGHPVAPWFGYDVGGSPRIQNGIGDMGADEFDVDCDSDGTPDYAEIKFGTATDCDLNGVPDGCQPLVDCNGNGIQDACDIKNGASADCNSNGIPDSCEVLADCDGDGISNACEIESFGEFDCNGNGIPDSCDIASGIATDVDRNGVPDVCHNMRAVPSQFPTIQAAIDACVDGDSVVIADGTYTGLGNQLLDFQGKSILVTSANGPARCILDGQQAASLVFLDKGPGLAHLRGLTFRRGSGSTGGAVFMRNLAEARFEACVFTDNHASIRGGAVAVEEAANVHFVGCQFTDNSAANRGGAIAATTGGIVAIDHSSLVGNSAVGATALGGAISIANQSVGTIRDSVIWSNSAFGGSSLSIGGVSVPSTAIVERSDFEGGQAGVHVAPGHTLSWGTGNLSLDPQFVDLAARDLHLTHTSPCRDAGSIAWAKDLEGDAQVGAPDIGADEFAPHAYTIGEASPGQSITLNVVGAPGSTPVFELFGTTLLAPPTPTPFGSLFAGPPFIGAGPFALPQMPSSGVIGSVIAIPASTPVGLTFYRQVVLGAPEATLTNLDVITIVP